jgi:nucleotide-binding universal stress UspA family protein
MPTIVAAYDEHESAARTLERAAELARVLGAHLVVLSVAPLLEQPPSIEALEPSFGGTPLSAARLAENPLALTRVSHRSLPNGSSCGGGGCTANRC